MACSSGQPQDGTLVVQDGHMGPIKLPEGVVFSTPLSDHMAEYSRRRSVVQSVADEAAPFSRHLCAAYFGTPSSSSAEETL